MPIRASWSYIINPEEFNNIIWGRKEERSFDLYHQITVLVNLDSLYLSLWQSFMFYRSIFYCVEFLQIIVICAIILLWWYRKVADFIDRLDDLSIYILRSCHWRDQRRQVLIAFFNFRPYVESSFIWYRKHFFKLLLQCLFVLLEIHCQGCTIVKEDSRDVIEPELVDQWLLVDLRTVQVDQGQCSSILGSIQKLKKFWRKFFVKLDAITCYFDTIDCRCFRSRVRDFPLYRDHVVLYLFDSQTASESALS